MAISFPNGFSINSNEPIDDRLSMTKAEMVAAKKARMPQTYFTVCKDDGKMYIYNADNEINEETGRFRVIETSLSSSTKEEVEQIISKDENNILTATDDGLKVEAYESIPSENITNLFNN